MFRLKRVYDEPESSDGFRVLVDRLWPRGLRKDRAAVDLWAKDVAPSAELRKWVHEDPARWDAFELRYEKELDNATDAVEDLRSRAAKQPVTLLYASRNTDVNHAQVLKRYLEKGSTK